MISEEKCKACGAVLFRKGPVDEKGDFIGVLGEDIPKLEQFKKREGEKEYYECPQCYGKNWLARSSEPGKGVRVWISHVT